MNSLWVHLERLRFEDNLQLTHSPSIGKWRIGAEHHYLSRLSLDDEWGIFWQGTESVTMIVKVLIVV